MIGSLLNVLLGPLGAALGAIVAVLAAYVTGSRNGRQRAKNEGLRTYKNTREKIDAVADTDGPDAARRWLSERSKR